MPGRSTLVASAAVVGLAYVYGLIIGGILLVWQVLLHGGMPAMPWWQWLLAPLGLGAFAMGAEGLVEMLQSKTGFGAESQSRSKRLFHLLCLFVLLTAVIIGPAFYKIANP